MTEFERLHQTRDEAPGAGTLFAAICDMNGILRGKRLPLAKLTKTQAEGIRMPLSSIGVDIWGVDVAGTRLTLEQGDQDGLCLPTGRAPVDLGWTGQGASLLPMWMRKEDGTPYFADARYLLADVLSRYQAKGLRPVVATELEFFLLDPGEGSAAPARGKTGNPPREFDNIYSLEELSEASGFLDEVCAMAAVAGIEVEAATSEGAPRQFEFNLLHRPDALKIADDTLFFKQIIKNVARRHGALASFMAKPYEAHAGSGLHVHFSVIDEAGRNIFDDGTDRGSDLMLSAVAGLLDCMGELTLACAPHLNSYRRLCPGGLAPTAIAWGYENRTSALRIPAGPHQARRVEHRVAGADANPYVVLATILGSALYGIEEKLTPPQPVVSNAHALGLQSLAKDWRQGLEWFAASPRVGRVLHPEFAAAFAACKQQEQDGFASRMTDFELLTYRLSV